MIIKNFRSISVDTGVIRTKKEMPDESCADCGKRVRQVTSFFRLNQLLTILDIPNDADLLVENTIYKLDSILRDEIARNQDFDPKSIDELMDFIIPLDNRLREREKERREIRFSEQRYLPRTSAFRPTPTASQGMQTTTSTQHFGPGPLPNDEKERRRSNNLCMYCGNPGHTTDACPKKGKIPARRL